MVKIFINTFGKESKFKNWSYHQRPVHKNYDFVAYPAGSKIPDFFLETVQNSGFCQIKQSRNEVEVLWNIYANLLYIQCGEASSIEICKLSLFHLSLSGAAFSWFIFHSFTQACPLG
jgi:hypothetical protein